MSDNLSTYIALKLAALGVPVPEGVEPLVDVARPLLRNYQEKSRLLSQRHAPVDDRLQAFLNAYLADVPGDVPTLPSDTFVLDLPGLARAVSLPPDQDSFLSPIVSTYRVKQGILHNPKHDRRTTEGVFHVAEGGFPIPGDKRAVPKAVFQSLLRAALAPPDDMMVLPYTASRFDPARVWVSLLMRPLVCPAIPERRSAKTTEIRFFAPGGMVGNLDFVESIFGNGGDPHLPENDSALDTDGWTGHTGGVLLAPHLINLTKKALGLPPVAEATDRQKRDRMFWTDPNELYNDGQAFKITARDARGVMFTIIADNYFGYCKKEVKTQISFSANLFGWAEEEHAGGAVAFASYDLGGRFQQEPRIVPQNGLTFSEMTAMYDALMDVKPEGYAVDREYPEVWYVPEDALFDLHSKTVSWMWNGKFQNIRLSPRNIHILPNGYKVGLSRQVGGQGWHLAGISAEGVLCHKPSTVSGGGKSEISKSIEDAMVQGPVFVADLQKDLDAVAAIIARNYGDRFINPRVMTRPSRPILSAARSLGSVIKLLTPAPEYTTEFNAWLASIPRHILDLVLILKRFYRPEWGDDWRPRFSVDMVNGAPGHELKVEGHRLRSSYIRVGYEKDGSRRIYRVRQDFDTADKVQMEDDITASVVVPRADLDGVESGLPGPSVKLVANCERRLFQRPDDAVIPGYDKQAEADIAGKNVFLSNWEPLTRPQVRDLVDDAPVFDQFTDSVRAVWRDFLIDMKPTFLVSSAHPRLVDGKPSKNPRYLQDRPDLVNARGTHVARMGSRLFRRVLLGRPLVWPVNAVLPARRNNPPDAKIGAPPLCVYNPIHYQELPELFMDFISSLTGKSPSTTGFGSEGALTKGPFNALPPIVDLNNALVAFVLTGAPGFSTAAGYIGPHVRVDHDISLLVPEIWARLTPEERAPDEMIRTGRLEKLVDFDHRGRLIPASRLGYRVTRRFAREFLGRIFNNPDIVFSEAILRPETQDPDVFADGIEAVAAAHKRVAEGYFEDGSVRWAAPPLAALLHIMAKGHWEGKDVNHPDVRRLFTLEAMLASDWYRTRLDTQQKKEKNLLVRHRTALENALAGLPPERVLALGLHERMARLKQEIQWAESPGALKSLEGYLGADPTL
ncbi:MAG: hypothetical protein IPJ35_03495 [Elusimicrobia bacterium]|nr:hypothetical protein [Elusimicrobiota bacterium]